ncbi:MarR family transcriptional regulator [Leuconostoc citreum]|uniref:MarR family winged helix-turn-helix transcriptional regulator n=1 Tax=Leuconostoc citreum TaxID=33964 RepID=UPI000590CF12|nr:MarR family transcriptional regulator [Leuconostoc citreum]KAF0261270.1 MarR family transcriptional regulator [Leuconostoc citreum]MCT3054772.1 MarR family transcriptional regulator [Leuconostoc citreum]MCT3063279.1 MarR family transcriptional regulator [Leuconostoc citreum]MCT3075443.1 MarR family transcriptional regulator [Leuconostoc citreum]MCT3076441.1 MarR family transcriptional regulator [Leuconostoc citreum]
MDKIEKLRYLTKAVDLEGEKQFAQLLSSEDITPTQNEVLKILAQFGSLSITEVGNLLICGSDNPSRVVQRLLLKNLVVKEKNSSDSRKTNLMLTDLGRSTLNKTIEIEKIFNQQIAQNFENTIEVDKLIEIFTKQISGSKTLQQISTRE